VLVDLDSRTVAMEVGIR